MKSVWSLSYIICIFRSIANYINLLLQNKIRTNWSTVTAISEALIDISKEIAQIIIDAGGDVDAMNNSGETPLMIAMRQVFFHTFICLHTRKQSIRPGLY